MATNGQTAYVYESLKKKINEGFYSPAENLREAMLAKEYSVSRNTVKKALLMLEADAYVTIEQNKGARVRSYSKTEVLEFLSLREVIEGFVVSLTAKLISDDEIKDLNNKLDIMAEKLRTEDFLGYSALNQKFHEVIYSICPNRMAVEILIKLKNQMKKYNSKSILIPGRRDTSLGEHKAILAALAEHDPEKARELTQKHIHNVYETYDKYYDILF